MKTGNNIGFPCRKHCLTAKMIELCKQRGYHGWYGIESSGREAIKQGKALLNKYLFNKHSTHYSDQ